VARIAFIGFGEAASAIVSGWGVGRHQINAYDVKLDSPSTRSEILARCEQHDVGAVNSVSEAVHDCDLIMSTVTADQAVVAAQSAAKHLKPQCYWFDLNSCAPLSKQAADAIVTGADARYVDVAVMAPVYPALNKVPLLVSGPHAETAACILNELPMNATPVTGPVGAASSIKMLRSVMVKGLEALTAECTLAAVAAGVDKEVFASLNRSHAGSEWNKQAAYNFERSVVHGIRRAAEMEEVAKMLSDLNLPNDMTLATVLWQRQLGQIDAEILRDVAKDDANSLASVLLKQVRK